MWHLYLDESGDLGFDFVNKKPSKFFNVTILAVSSEERNKALISATKKVIRKKLNPKNKNKIHELKGSQTTLEIKKYFYKQVKEIKFGIYSITLNKKRLYNDLSRNKDRVYNFIARQVIYQIPFEKFNDNAIDLIVDRSKGKPEISDFNFYIKGQLEAKITPKIPINIFVTLNLMKTMDCRLVIYFLMVFFLSMNEIKTNGEKSFVAIFFTTKFI